MFDPLLNLVNPSRRSRALHAPFIEWGASQGLQFEAGKEGACTLSGRWAGLPVRVEVQPASRPYINGHELFARAELDLDPLSSVVLMNRPLKRELERWADYLYSQLTNSVQTMADSLPEEVRWMATFRDLGWAGPGDDFWARFAVVTDAPEEARAWIDAATAQGILGRLGNVDTPVLFTRLRGKVQMRVQMAGPRAGAHELGALAVFRSLCARARGEAPESVSSLG